MPTSIRKTGRSAWREDIVSRRAKRHVDRLLATFDSETYEPEDHWFAVEQLGALDEDSIAAFVAVSNEDGLRSITASVLLCHLCAARPHWVARDSIREDACSRIREALRSSSLSDQLWCCLMFSRYPAPQVLVPSLQGLLSKDRPDDLRVLAAAALAKAGNRDSKTLRVLKQGIHSEIVKVRTFASVALLQASRFSADAMHDVGEAFKQTGVDGKHYMVQMLGTMGTDALKLAGLANSVISDPGIDDVIRGLACKALGAMCRGTNRADGVLATTLHSDRPELVRGAIHGLRAADRLHKPHIERIRECLGSTDDEMVKAVVHALAGIGRNAEPLLPELLTVLDRDDDVEYLQTLATVLAGMGTAVIDPLVEILKKRRLAQVGIVCGTFMQLPVEAVGKLAEYLIDDPDEYVRGVLYAAVREMGPTAAPLVPVFNRVLLETDDADTVMTVLLALMGIGKAAAQAVPALVDCFLSREPNLADMAERTLRVLGRDAVAGIEAEIADASASEARKLMELLDSMRALGTGRYGHLLAARPNWVSTFVLMGDVLAEKSPQSYSSIATALRKSRKLTTGPGALRITVNKLAKLLGTELVIGKERVGIKLSRDGKKVLDEARLRVRLGLARSSLANKA